MSAKSQPSIIKAWAIWDERFGVNIKDMHATYDDAAIRCRFMNDIETPKRELFFPVAVEIRKLDEGDAMAQLHEET